MSSSTGTTGAAAVFSGDADAPPSPASLRKAREVVVPPPVFRAADFFVKSASPSLSPAHGDAAAAAPLSNANVADAAATAE